MALLSLFEWYVDRHLTRSTWGVAVMTLRVAINLDTKLMSAVWMTSRIFGVLFSKCLPGSGKNYPSNLNCADYGFDGTRLFIALFGNLSADFQGG